MLLCSLGSGMVRLSRIGSVRLCALSQGQLRPRKVRLSWSVLLWSGHVRQVGSRSDATVEFRQCVFRLVRSSWIAVAHGSHVELVLAGVSRRKAALGTDWQPWIVMSVFCPVCRGGSRMARQSSSVTERRCMARRVNPRYGSRGWVWQDAVWSGKSRLCLSQFVRFGTVCPVQASHGGFSYGFA